MDQEARIAGEVPLGEGQILALIRGIEIGSSSALLSFYDGTSRLIFGLIMQILRDRTSAEATLLDVYTEVWREPGNRDLEITPLEWLIRIARFHALSKSHWTKKDGAKAGMVKSRSDSSTTVSPRQQNSARTCLDSLASAQRTLLEWAYYSGLSCVEIAAQIGRPVGAVRTHIRLGLSKLRDSVEPVSELGPEGRPPNRGIQ